MPNISVLGMGAMGSRIALSLLHAGNQVTVWNRDPAKTQPLADQGAQTAATPAEAVKQADFAIAMVRDVEASRRVWLDGKDGALAALPRSAVAIETSTITVASAQELAAAAAGQGIAMLDAPVSGSRKQADARELIFLCGGDRDIIERATPVLRQAGRAVQHMGPAGAGIAMKLMVNSSLATQLASLAELLALAEKAGIPRDRAMEVYTGTVVVSPWIKANAASILARDYSPQFTVELIEKDLQYAQQAAESLNVTLPVTDAARQIYTHAKERGSGDDNLTAIAELYK